MLLSSCAVSYISDFNSNQPELFEKKNDVRITGNVNATMTNRFIGGDLPFGGEIHASYAFSPRYYVETGYRSGGWYNPFGLDFFSRFRSFTLGGGYYKMTEKRHYFQAGLRYVRGDEAQYENDAMNRDWEHWRSAIFYHGADLNASASILTKVGRLGLTSRFSVLTSVQDQRFSRFGVYFNYSTSEKRHLVLSLTTGYGTALSKEHLFLNNCSLILRPTLIYCFNSSRNKHSITK